MRPASSPSLRSLFCVSDGRGAAILDGRGRCWFWSPPGFDGPLRLARLLDPRGVSVAVRPRIPGSPKVGWSAPQRVMLARWGDRDRLEVAATASGRGRPVVLWVLRGEPGLEAVVELQGPAAGPGWEPAPSGAVLPAGPWPDGPGGPLRLEVRPAAPISTAPIPVPPEGLLVSLALGVEPGPGSPAPLASLRSEVSGWQRRQHTSAGGLRLRAPGWAREAVATSLAQIHALQHPATGLVVASPVTSIPQWPGSTRAWDYRYAWLRDNADAGAALTLGGDLEGAARLARGLGQLLGHGTQPVRRLDGSPLPPERALPHLQGYLGSVVRVGNGAALQAQVDTLGEVCRFAHLLDGAGACPTELLEHVPRLADAAAAGWSRADHGIWEVRGRRRHYLHSKILAWVALDRALDLARRGRIADSGAFAWARARGQLESAVARRGLGPAGQLRIAFGEEGADSATLAAYLVDYPLPSGPGYAATLDHVLSELGAGPLVARHRPERDGIPYPCLPFIFPSFWAAAAEAVVGRRARGAARFRALLRLAGPSGQLSEVADPATGQLLGNYPQVQSHAALVEAAFALWGGLTVSRAPDLRPGA